jgi:tripartite-type tricarboxylate transporter receptor subunit TctC
MMPPLRAILALLLFWTAAAAAQPSIANPSSGYPARPVKLVVGFAPGGAADIVARALQDPLSHALGQPIVIDNRPGAGSSIAAEFVAKSAPDGYTLLIASPSSILVNPIISPKAGFDPRRDLAAIGKVSSSPLVLAVNPATGINSVAELIAFARKNPGKLNYATSGNGAAPHLAAVLFMHLANVQMVHVPYKGGGPAVQSVLSGETQLSFATPPSVLPLVQGGRLKALAVTSRNRTPLVPGVPGMAEAGLPDYEISFWYGFFAPAGTPEDALKKVFAATGEALRVPKVNETLARVGTETSGSSSAAEFNRFIDAEAVLWAKLVKESGAKPE